MTPEQKIELRTKFRLTTEQAQSQLFLDQYYLPDLEDWIEKSFPVEKPVILQGELLPCPFCGGKASVATTRISCKRTAELNGRTNGFFINCIICGSNNNCLHLGYATKEIAIEHWNKRAGREPQSK